MTIRTQIRTKAIELLKQHPQGIRYSELVNMLNGIFPDYKNNIEGNIWDLHTTFPNEIYRAGRGLFRHISFKETEIQESGGTETEAIPEENFYEGLAKFLKGVLECTQAIPLGGNIFGDKWATPDVIGTYISSNDDIIKKQEIIASELKTDIDIKAIITAFGQACAYKLFSHKVYVVIPQSCSDENKDRIKSLCLICGVGLILFKLNIENPEFDIKIPPTKHEPDDFYVNEYLNKLPHNLRRILANH